MKAMILAAGLGTRLYPLTQSKPKALVEIKGRPMLEIIIRRLIRYGFTDIVINVHHFAGQIIDFLSANHNFGATIHISDERDLLLDTGGGILKAKDLLFDGQPFLIHNVDILTDFDLNELYNFHMQQGPLATLAVKERKTSRSLLVNKNNELCGWKNQESGKTIISREKEEDLFPIAFSAVHVMSPEIFPLITETGVFSITDVYLRLAQTQRILTWRHDESFWMDLGKAEHIKDAGKYVDLLG